MIPCSETCLPTSIKQCPTCRQKFKHNQHVKTDRNTRNLISLLLFECKNEACDIIVPLNELQKHYEVCQFGRIICIFCQIEISRSDEKVHKEQCELKVKLKVLEVNLRDRDSTIDSLKRILSTKDTELALVKDKLDQAEKEQTAQVWLKTKNMIFNLNMI